MTTLCFNRLWAATCVAGVLACRSVLGAGPPPSEAALSALVKALGSDDFLTREHATTRLEGWEAASPHLARTLKSPDAEVRARASRLLAILEPGAARRALRRLIPRAADGAPDLLPEAAAKWGRHDLKDESFRAAAFLAARLAVTGQGRQPLTRPLAWDQRLPIRDLDLLLNGLSHKRADSEVLHLRGAGRWLASGGEVVVETGAISSIFLSRGTFRAKADLVSCVVIANGDVELEEGCNSCVIITDGAIRLKGWAFTSILFSRGPISALASHAPNSLFVSAGGIGASRSVKAESLLHAHAPSLLGALRFFDVAEVGLKLDGREVRAVRKDCPLATAGLRIGDVFLSVDGVAVKSFDGLRRALRRRWVIAGVGEFVIRRGGTTLTLRAGLVE